MAKFNAAERAREAFVYSREAGEYAIKALDTLGRIFDHQNSANTIETLPPFNFSVFRNGTLLGVYGLACSRNKHVIGESLTINLIHIDTAVEERTRQQVTKIGSTLRRGDPRHIKIEARESINGGPEELLHPTILCTEEKGVMGPVVIETDKETTPFEGVLAHDLTGMYLAELGTTPTRRELTVGEFLGNTRRERNFALIAYKILEAYLEGKTEAKVGPEYQD